jgi:hypothetical protein
MLALIRKSDNSFVEEVLAGGAFSVGNDVTSPAYDGWSNSSYRLVQITSPTSEIPLGKQPQVQSVEVAADGLSAQYVWSFVDASRPTHEDVNAERDNRIASGFQFNGKSYSMDSESKARIIGAATLAGFAMAAGKGAGDYRWHGAVTDFAWIADDNSLNPMDAPTCFEFGQAAAAWETKQIFLARAIKQMNPIPYDYKSNSYWNG